MILTEFRKLPFYNQLAHRRAGFELCLLHMDRQPPASLILETGTLRIPGNYYGDGNSSAIWEWLLERRPFEAVSVDIDENAVEAARRELKKVQVVHSDSLVYLSSLTPEKLSHCRLLYLDSFDWSPEIELDSAFHHFAELATVWRLLPSDCLIMVDDRHSETSGKHFMVQFFMEKLGIEPVYKGHQIGWLKP